MKISMKNSEEKGGSSSSSLNGNGNKIRIAVFGQHDVGKSALTVRYLTKRFIGVYKSNTDLLYRQTLSVSHGTLDIEIVDISTNEGPDSFERKTFPVEEIHRADGFIIVYSITDRSSFTFALEALSDIYACYAAANANNANTTSQTPNNSSPQPKPTCPVALIANKNDLEHLRVVEKVEGATAALQYGCQFYELSVAENSPEVYSSFQTIITTLISQTQAHQPSKRKFSVSKMLGNLRLGRTSPSNSVPVPTAPASIVDTNVITSSGSGSGSSPNSPARFGGSRENSPGMGKASVPSTPGKKHQRQGSSSSSEASSSSSSSSSSGSSLSNSICHLKSKLVELHSIKKRHNSPPICSL